MFRRKTDCLHWWKNPALRFNIFNNHSAFLSVIKSRMGRAIRLMGKRETRNNRLTTSWKANSRSVSQETLLILWNKKLHYRAHKRPPLVPIQMNPVHIITPHLHGTPPPHAHVDLPLQSIEATGITVPIGSNEVLLAAVYKPRSKPWCDEDSNNS
jgi:hypothetical protein